MSLVSDPRRAYRALQPSDFPFRAEIPARLSDLDMLRHVNNVAVAEIMGEGRINFLRQLFKTVERPAQLRFMVGQVAISYIEEAHYPSTFVIGIGVAAIGRSSVRLAQGFFDKGRCTSVAETVLIATADHRPSPLAASIRTALASYTIEGNLVPSQLRGRRTAPADSTFV